MLSLKIALTDNSLLNEQNNLEIVELISDEEFKNLISTLLFQINNRKYADFRSALIE